MDTSLEFLLLVVFLLFHMLLTFGIIKGNKKRDNLNILICKNNIATIKSFGNGLNLNVNNFQ